MRTNLFTQNCELPVSSEHSWLVDRQVPAKSMRISIEEAKAVSITDVFVDNKREKKLISGFVSSIVAGVVLEKFVAKSHKLFVVPKKSNHNHSL